MAEQTTQLPPPPTLKAWGGLDAALRQRLLRELEETVAKPPSFVECVGDNFDQKAAFHMGRYAVMTDLRKQLRNIGVFD